MPNLINAFLSDHKKIWTYVKILLALCLVVFLFFQTSSSVFLNSLRNLSLPWFMGMVMAFCASLLFSALRYRHLGLHQIRFRSLLVIVIIQNALSVFLTSAAGIAYYVTLLRSEHDVPIHHGIGSFAFTRWADALVLSVTLCVAGIFVYPVLVTFRRPLTILMICAIALATSSILAIGMRKLLCTFLAKTCIRLRIEKKKSVSNLLAIFSELAKPDGSAFVRLIFPLIGFTFLANAAIITAIFCTIRTFSIPITIPPVLFTSTITQFMATIPIQVFGGLGVCDVPAMYLYGLFGVDHTRSAVFLIGSRIFVYLIYGSLLLAIWVDGFRTKKVSRQVAGAASLVHQELGQQERSCNE